MIEESRGSLTPAAAEMLALDAFTWLAGEDEALDRFMALTGLEPGALRRASREPGFLAGIVAFLMADEPALLAFAGHAGIPAERVAAAHATLNGGE
jgi:hypothetical protein